MSADRHEAYRALLAERMDTPLDPSDAARLETHLAGCAACRCVAHDYEADRERIRSARTPEPPRDLWARTSAALDREVADEADGLLGPTLPGRRRQLRLATASMVTALVVLALTGGQLMPETPSGLATATPFAIPAQTVSYVGVADGELTFYRADVDEVCPQPRVDCADGPDGEAVISLGAPVHTRALAMNATGQLFISGRDDLGEEVFAIVTLPREPDASVIDGAPAVPSPDASTNVDAAAGSDPNETRNPDLGQVDPPTPQPTDGADVLPSRTPDATDPAAPPSISPPAGPVEVATSQSILSDALATGAAAAWSPDGTTLAFSAMRADRSRGSDVYVWKPGDKQAHAVTDDHASYFASWSGSRIVASRIDPKAIEGGSARATTVVIDPASGDLRPVDLERAWLPTVDPTGRYVIYWRGRLAEQAGVAVPDDGRLYLADWTSLDPWPTRAAAAEPAAHTKGGAGAPGDATGAGSKPAPGGAPPDAAVTSSDDQATSSEGQAAPPGTAAGDEAAPTTDPASQGASAVPDEASADDDAAPGTPPPAEPGAQGGAVVEPSNGDSATNDGGSPDATDKPASPAPFVMGRARAVSGQTRDWVVRWSDDGGAYAVWTGDPSSSLRGSLVVRSVPSADAPTGETLVARSPASRSFGLGDHRIAWVAPLADGHGELWVSAWGARGLGSLKLRRLDSMEAVPAY